MVALEAALAPLALSIAGVQTRARDRLTYLQQPDLGRKLDGRSRAALEDHARAARHPPDLVIVVADGLSAGATQIHAPALLAFLLPRLRGSSLTIAPLVAARYARVALQDEVGQVFAAQCALILLGERPGLAAADSLGAYFVLNPRVGNTDAERNCVSNIRPAGLPLAAAAETLEYLITESLRRRVSGTLLKDERRPAGGVAELQPAAPGSCKQ
jgi:ethanolamine ammonia-lyase small subunit